MNKLFEQRKSISTPRNGFDHSKRMLFSAAAGQLLPIMCKECMAGDYIEENIASLTRTNALNTAAFAKFTENYDFFFVPMRLLFSNFGSLKTGTNAMYGKVNNHNSISRVPTINAEKLITMNNGEFAGAFQNTDVVKLWSLFGSGIDRLCDINGVIPTVTTSAVISGQYDGNDPFYKFFKTDVSALPFAAYERIYNDFYRDSRWEVPNFNLSQLDWVYGASSNFKMYDISGVSLHPYWIKYANYNRDMFLGTSPTMQYGDAAVVSVFTDIARTLGGSDVPLTSQSQSGNPDKFLLVYSDSNQQRLDELKGQFDLVSYRFGRALQRWKEVVMSNPQNYRAQMKAQFGIDVPDVLSNAVEFIDGFNNTIEINEVVSTAETTGADLGQLAGKGIGFSNGSKTIKYSVKEDGYFFCIYHIKPEVSYDAYGMDKQLLHIERDDFYNPAYDNVALEAVNSEQLDITTWPGIIGYTSRYIEYKTDVDKCYLGFTSQGAYNTWSMHFDNYPSMMDDDSFSWNYSRFKISPYCTDPLFKSSYSGKPADDPFKCCVYHDCNMVRNMFVDTLDF